MRFKLASLAVVLLAISPAYSQTSGNLLRNADFQDDWITFLPETKNHHWCFPSEFFNRRDFNPDGWFCKGSWLWRNAEAPPGQRRLVLQGPGAEIRQRVNYFAIHDDRSLEGFPDAGGYPSTKTPSSRFPEKLLRDLSFRVLLTGQAVPDDAATLELALCPPGGTDSADPMGTLTAPTVLVSAKAPAGTYTAKLIEVKLPANLYVKALQTPDPKLPKKAIDPAAGVPLPATIMVVLRYKGKTGSLEVEKAELEMVGQSSSNLLANGTFEALDDTGYPKGWTRALKYRYFPPRHYYIFNTWHNANFANRGFAAADPLLPQTGKHSLRMIVPSGDEMMVLSDPIALNQKDARLLEVTAWIKTDRLCMLQVDAVTDQGKRLDGFNFIHKAPASIGTDGWRQIRQVFRPREPVKSLRLALCARGVNGYTLDDTGTQPQNNVVGTVWWDNVRLAEPESADQELKGRGVTVLADSAVKEDTHLQDLDLGERLLGANVLRATVVNQGPPRSVVLEWKFASPSGKETTFRSKPQTIKTGTPTVVEVPYNLIETCPTAYTEYRGQLGIQDEKGKALAASEIWFGTWTTSIDIDLGALYLRPEQKQYVRMNFGFAHATLNSLKTVRLEVVRRGSGQTMQTVNVDASPAALAIQRSKIPIDLRDDFANLLLADLDVSALPVQPFADPQRNWFVRAMALDSAGKVIGQAESPPFCRQSHEPPQPPIQNVTIKGEQLYVNGQPWLPFGVCYGHTPVYTGPADPGAGKYRDLANLPGWSLYDRHNQETSTRKQYDFNCMRYVAGAISPPAVMDKRWQADNLYCSSAFAVPDPAFSLDELAKKAGGKDKLAAYLAYCKKAPMVVSVAPGIEEAFGLFQGATPEQLKGLQQIADFVRKESGKPVMVGHGGYWNRLEFEKATFFDIFDPETEPLYPGNIHTDLRPLVQGKNKVVWLRPQMYESIPYERWRFHTYVEMMRGCRGWQIAHGPGDASLFRGLHGEIEFFKSVLASPDPGPKVAIEPGLEHWSRRFSGKTYIIAASTRGIPLGKWHWADEGPPGSTRSRLTDGRHELRDETNAYGIGSPAESGPTIHGIQYLPDARAWTKGSKLVQWVKLDAKAPPKNLVILAKGDGRWTHGASWGKPDLAKLRKDPATAYWFLNSFYRHAKGFLGWGMDLLPKSLEYIPDKSLDLGKVPETGQWVKLEIPLEAVGAAGKLLDGIGFLHEDGRVWWGKTSLVDSDGTETIILGDSVERSQEDLAKVKINVEGLAAGAKVKVLFEDRELTAAAGYFLDDFRGQDLYQRYGGGFGTGYGDAPVALHLYEVTTAKK